jgi:hypothetical protein
MTDSARQIKQMTNFIMQEANEKCNELKIKVKKLYNFYFYLIIFSYNIYSKI